MSRTPTRIDSAISGNFILVTPTNTDRLIVNIYNRDGRSMASATIDPAELAGKMIYIPGMTAKYTKPISVPQYLGAVVMREGRRWVRVLRKDEASYCWVRASAPAITANDDEIAAVLANGGHEVEPEFPIRTP